MDKESEEEKPDAGEKEKEETKEGTSSALETLSQLQGTITKVVTDNLPPTEATMDRLGQVPESIKNLNKREKEEKQAGTSSAFEKLSQLQGTITKVVNDNMPPGETAMERFGHMPESIKKAVNKQLGPASAPEEASTHENVPTRGLTAADFIDQIQKVPESIQKMIHDKQQEVAERGFSPVAMEYVPDSIKKMMGMQDGQQQAGAAASSNKAAGGQEQQGASDEPDVQTMSAVAQSNDTDTSSGAVVVKED